MSREMVISDAEGALLEIYIRRGVSIKSLLVMYRCTLEELGAWLRKNLPHIESMLAACPAEPSGKPIGRNDDYPPFPWRK